MIDKNQKTENNLKIIMQAIRFGGVLLFFFGLAVLFNLGGVSTNIGFVETGTYKLIGMLIAIFGIVEIILTPRVLESILKK